jgi:hypothetical protein
MGWWGVKLRMVVVVEGEDKASVNDGVFVLRAGDDWEDAFREALALGRRQEREYLNKYGERVRWRFAEVLQIHGGIDDDRELDGQEAMSEMLADQIDLSFDAELHPERSEPAES